MRWVICFVSLAISIASGTEDAAAQDARTYSLTPKVSLRVTGPWVESPVKYSNATEFVVKGEVRVPTDQPAPSSRSNSRSEPAKDTTHGTCPEHNDQCERRAGWHRR
jgi:hypothetical protein